MSEKTKNNFVSGFFLIIIGILIIGLKQRVFHNISIFPILMGGFFLAGYLSNKSYGLLIPGCLLLSIGLTGGRTHLIGFRDFGSFGLGIGFVAIYVIDLIYRGKTHWWPLIPGIILILTGTRKFTHFISIGWPILIILFGIWIIIRSFQRKDEEDNPES